MWYVAANRDENSLPMATALSLTARMHAATSPLAMASIAASARGGRTQISTLIEEMAKRNMRVELADKVVREAHPS